MTQYQGAGDSDFSPMVKSEEIKKKVKSLRTIVDRFLTNHVQRVATEQNHLRGLVENNGVQLTSLRTHIARRGAELRRLQALRASSGVDPQSRDTTLRRRARSLRHQVAKVQAQFLAQRERIHAEAEFEHQRIYNESMNRLLNGADKRTLELLNVSLPPGWPDLARRQQEIRCDLNEIGQNLTKLRQEIINLEEEEKNLFSELKKLSIAEAK